MFKFIEKVHNCPALRDVSSMACKDTKAKQKKIEELAEQLGFVQAFLFLHRFLFLIFSSSVSPLYASATAPIKSAMLQISVCCDLTRV